MVQRSAPERYYAERYFPVRVGVAVPPGGFGRQLDEMYAWLDQHVGKSAYWVGSEAGASRIDAALFYFIEAKSAAAFVDRFSCGLVLDGEPPVSARRS
jgi:hypothetical protein